MALTYANSYLTLFLSCCACVTQVVLYVHVQPDIQEKIALWIRMSVPNQPLHVSKVTTFYNTTSLIIGFLPKLICVVSFVDNMGFAVDYIGFEPLSPL